MNWSPMEMGSPVVLPWKSEIGKDYNLSNEMNGLSIKVIFFFKVLQGFFPYT